MVIDITSLPDVTRTLPGTVLRMVEEHLTDELVRVRENPLAYGHAPHEGQERLVSSRKRRKMLVCANRWGKTEIAMREVLWRARGDHPYRDDIRLHDVIWVGMPDYPSYMRYTKPTFDAWCPPSWIVGQFNNQDKYVDIRRVDGGTCRIFFLSYDMPRTKWQGAAVDFLWMDEEMPEDLFNEAVARTITVRGDVLLTFTPVGGMGWWYDRLLVPAQKGLNDWDVVQGALATRDVSKPEDCEVGESLVPHMTREMVIDFAKLYPDEVERSIRVFGDVRGRTGVIYKAWNRQVHMIPRFDLPRTWELWAAADPGYHGFTVVFFAISPTGIVYVVDEYYSQEESTGTRFAELRKRVAELRGLDLEDEDDPDAAPVSLGEPVPVFVDTEDPQTTLELNIESQKVGTPLVFVSLDQGLKAVKAGILRIQQLLTPSTTRPTPRDVQRERPVEGEPLMYIFEDLHSQWRDGDRVWAEGRLVWEFERYLWKKPPRGSNVPPDEPDKHSAGGAHILDAFRYGVMSRVSPSEPEAQQQADRGRDSWVWDDIDAYEEQILAEQEIW